ncbi:hypothetical protein ACDF64_03295 [Agromyces sp. MMS24-JH15]|uniref:hypothetical protein n=1 Tax=Agromyces sp. MMS24-JH15 TaxID=3243765 RepID=UPI003749C957
MSGAPAPGERDAAGRDAERMPPAAAPPALPRVRVTAPRPGTGATPTTGNTSTSDIQGEYVRALIRSQLRIALVHASGFVGATAVFLLAVALVPGLDEASILGLPVSWLLLAFGVYPLIITVAALQVRAAARTEARYRSLASDAPGEGAGAGDPRGDA